MKKCHLRIFWLYIEKKILVPFFLPKLRLRTLFFHSFRTLKTCFSNLTLNNFNNYHLRVFWLFQEKNLPPLAQTLDFYFYFSFFDKHPDLKHQFQFFSHLKDLFFSYDFGETNKRIFMVGCQVTYIPNFTNILQYSRNRESWEGGGQRNNAWWKLFQSNLFMPFFLPVDIN